MAAREIQLILLLSGLTVEALCQAPGCPNVNAGPDTVLSCGTSCANLTATLLQTGQTTAYTASSIPYSPPFSFTGGTTLFIGIDDIWSGTVNMPFNFCFYGNFYNQIVIGANGVITFNTGLAGGWCEWSFSAPIPTPGPPSAGIYNNSINGAYHDIDPSVTWTGAGNDINYAVLGSPPCRTFVISYYDVPHFDCNNLNTTQQIVLYETTNVIEVYIADKPTCFSWNSGNAVIGLQNANGTLGTAAPGRNTGPWSASNEAWRFTPSGSPNYSVQWYDGNVLAGTGNPANVCPLVPTAYTGLVTYTNCDGSTVAVTDTVMVTPTICGCTAVISSSTNPSCPGVCDGTATVNLLNGAPPYTYSWSPSGGGGPAATGLCEAIPYTVIVIDSNIDTCYASVTMSAASGLNVNISSSKNPDCPGAADGYAIATASGGSGAFTYFWSPSGGSGPIATGLSGGITYTIVVMDSNGCAGADTVTLIDPPALIASITAFSNPSCDTSTDGSATAAANGGTAPYIYSWSPTGGTGPVATGLTGNVTYIITVTDSGGCMDSDTIILIQPLALVASITSSTNPSCDTSTDGTALVTVSGGTTPYTSYIWSPSGGNTAIAIGLSGNINYTVIVTDTNNCSAMAQVMLTAPSPLLAVMSGDDSLCTGDTANLLVSCSGGTGNYSYLWAPAGGPDSSGSVTPVSNTTYFVTVTDANGCLANINYDVAIKPLPPVDFTSDVIDGCEPLEVLFTNLNPGGASCFWDIGDTTSFACDYFAHTFNDPGNYSVSLNVTGINGCTASLTKPDYISVYAVPAADFTADPWRTSVFTPTISFTDQSLSPDCWNWNFGGIDSSVLQNPDYTFPQTQNDIETYAVTLMVCTYEGCTDSITKYVTIEGNFIYFVPSSFTPDDDGINDYFIPKGTGVNWNKMQLSIYDRWGAEIYTTENGEPWDGKNHSSGSGVKAVQQDVYVWKLMLREINGKLHFAIGHVSVVK